MGTKTTQIGWGTHDDELRAGLVRKFRRLSAGASFSFDSSVEAFSALTFGDIYPTTGFLWPKRQTWYFRPPVRSPMIEVSSPSNWFEQAGTVTFETFSAQLPFATSGYEWASCKLPSKTASTSRADWVTEGEIDVKPRAGWLDGMVQRISNFSQLGRNWDSYGGIPPDFATIGRAMAVAIKLNGLFAASPMRRGEVFVAPLSSGGILFEIRGTNRELNLELDPKNADHFEALKLSEVSSGEKIEEEMFLSEQQLPEALAWAFR